MITSVHGNFQFIGNMITNANPEDEDADIQFGMDFNLTDLQDPAQALCQLIFPAIAVGNNQPGQWNIDNHREGHAPVDLIFNNAENGEIVDHPRELSHPNVGIQVTRFAVYRVNLDEGILYSNGVQFGYMIDTNSEQPETAFFQLRRSVLSEAQAAIIIERCPTIEIVEEDQ